VKSAFIESSNRELLLEHTGSKTEGAKQRIDHLHFDKRNRWKNDKHF
jgi:hypothetical protein